VESFRKIDNVNAASATTATTADDKVKVSSDEFCLNSGGIVVVVSVFIIMQVSML
jgi:hypothetical protein